MGRFSFCIAMNLGINNRTALVCASSKGLGRACAEQLAAAGCRLIMCARNHEVLSATAADIRKAHGVEVVEVQADLSRSGEVDRVVAAGLKAFGTLDILVANSGGPKPGSFFETDREDWLRAYESLLGYVVDLYRLVLPIMIKSRWGRVINIASVVVKQPAPSLVLSNVFRTGVVALAKTLAPELIRHNITINNVCPGAFRTDRALQLMQDEATRRSVGLDVVEAERVRNLPAGRFQNPAEFGALVAFLASDHAATLTGCTIQHDQGISQGLL